MVLQIKLFVVVVFHTKFKLIHRLIPIPLLARYNPETVFFYVVVTSRCFNVNVHASFHILDNFIYFKLNLIT